MVAERWKFLAFSELICEISFNARCAVCVVALLHHFAERQFGDEEALIGRCKSIFGLAFDAPACEIGYNTVSWQRDADLSLFIEVVIGFAESAQAGIGIKGNAIDIFKSAKSVVFEMISF